MISKIFLVLLILAMGATHAQAQLAIGDSQMDAWRQLKGFGLHLDSVVQDGKVRIYTADSIRIAGLLNRVTVHLNDSQRVGQMIFEARDIDSATFYDKYTAILTSPRVTRRSDDGNLLMLHLEHPTHMFDLIYDRKQRYIREVDLPVGKQD